MTVKLYLESIEAAYARQFDARITAVDGNTVVLDRTLFYPLGGGQHWDTGVLSGPNGDVHVSEVRGRGMYRTPLQTTINLRSATKCVVPSTGRLDTHTCGCTRLNTS